MNGWLLLDRSILSKPIFRHEKLLKVWIWCLCKARSEPGEVTIGLQTVQLQAGEFCFGRFTAAEELYMHPSSVYRLLKSLEKNQSIIIKSNNKFSVVTIVNWELYQSPKSRPNNKKTTNKQQINTNKEDKEDKEIYIYTHWNSKKIIQHQELKDTLRSTIHARLEAGYTVEQICEAIDNYNIVLTDDKYFWTYKWELQEFLSRGLDKFLTKNEPLKNFLAEKKLLKPQRKSVLEDIPDD